MSSVVRAVVFDLDGTLLDTLTDIVTAANAVLSEAGLPTHSEADFRMMIGEGVRRLFEQAVPADRREPSFLEDCVVRFGQMYSRSWDVTTRPYEGIPELLAELARRGLPLAILSNKPHAFTNHCIQRYFPETDFAVIFGQRTGVPPKPDPTGALQLAELLNVAPGDCAYLGDSWIDMHTAVAAGMIPLGVSWGFRSVKELRDAGAKVILDRPEEFLAWLDASS